MKRTSLRIFVVVVVFSFVYAILRYHVFEGVPPKDFPLYVVNKALALSAFILLTLNFALGPLRGLGVGVPQHWLNCRKEIGTRGFLLAFAHVVMSLLLFSPAYYQKFFAQDQSVSAVGTWAMAAGVASFVLLWIYYSAFNVRRGSDDKLRHMISSKALLLLAMVISAAHVSVMGFAGWLTPGQWAGGMPPITLVAFGVFVVGFMINLAGRE